MRARFGRKYRSSDERLYDGHAALEMLLTQGRFDEAEEVLCTPQGMSLEGIGTQQFSDLLLNRESLTALWDKEDIFAASQVRGGCRSIKEPRSASPLNIGRWTHSCSVSPRRLIVGLRELVRRRPHLLLAAFNPLHHGPRHAADRAGHPPHARIPLDGILSRANRDQPASLRLCIARADWEATTGTPRSAMTTADEAPPTPADFTALVEKAFAALDEMFKTSRPDQMDRTLGEIMGRAVAAATNRNKPWLIPLSQRDRLAEVVIAAGRRLKRPEWEVLGADLLDAVARTLAAHTADILIVTGRNNADETTNELIEFVASVGSASPPPPTPALREPALYARVLRRLRGHDRN